MKKSLKIRSLEPQYSDLWIVFDRDEVKDFDNIIDQAKSKQINVGWSNPCIEIWFHAYFGSMPVSQNSQTCNREFGRVFKQKCGQLYSKSDEQLYQTLIKYGDEAGAIELAKQKMRDHEMNCKTTPSRKLPATTLYELIEEIRLRIQME